MGRGIGRPEIRILEALALFDQLTAEQLSRYLDNSFRYTQDNCKRLAEGKYLQRLTLPKRTQAGGVPYVYTLARKGRRYLSDLDEEAPEAVQRRYRPSDQQARLHTLAINEVLLQVRKLAETDPTLSLVNHITEREFREEPISVKLANRTVSLIPDLWIHLRQQTGGKTYSYYFCIEMNLTPVEQKRWRRKVSLYLNCSDGYKKRVRVDVFQVVTFVESPALILRRGVGAYSQIELKEKQRDEQISAKTRGDYIQWTEQELIEQNKVSESDLFLFTNAPLYSLTPHKLLYSEHFVLPFEQEHISLIE